MHVYPARVITPERVWTPTTAQEDPGEPGNFIVDAKDGRRLATLTDTTVVLAPEHLREAAGTERLWLVAGTLDGEPVEWAVQMARGCGCGGTQELSLSDTDREVLG